MSVRSTTCCQKLDIRSTGSKKDAGCTKALLTATWDILVAIRAGRIYAFSELLDSGRTPAWKIPFTVPSSVIIT